MKKNITLINLDPPYEMEASTLILASSHRSSSVLQLLVCEKEILLKDLTAPSTKLDDDVDDVVQVDEDVDDDGNGNKNDDKKATESKDRKESNEEEKKGKPIPLDALGDIFAESHTVILPDSMFYDKSRIYFTETFLSNGGLDALQKFYKDGGTVIVMCLEGFLFSIDEKLKGLFGTDWKIKFSEIGACQVVPTDSARSVLGQFLPKSPLLKENPHFITCPNSREGLYKPLLQTKEQFVESFHAQDEVFERLGIEEDKSMDCFNVEKSWEKYLEQYTDCYVVALHEGGTSSDGKREGSVVWYGDRGQSDTMAFVFCKLLNLDPHRRLGVSAAADTTSGDTTTTKSITSNLNAGRRKALLYCWDLINVNGGGWTVLASIFVVLVAIAVRLAGMLS
ncbi:hypothetical protein ACA910_007956 [Epithemia clementina (nom. ined.)]